MSVHGGHEHIETGTVGTGPECISREVLAKGIHETMLVLARRRELIAAEIVQISAQDVCRFGKVDAEGHDPSDTEPLLPRARGAV